MDSYKFPHTECSICQEIYKTGDDVYTIRSCAHTFHKSCLDPWLVAHKTCPNCRVTIEQGDPIPSPAPALDPATYDYLADPDRRKRLMTFAFMQLLINWFTPVQYEQLKSRFRFAAAGVVIRGTRLSYMEIPFESRLLLEQTYDSLVPKIRSEFRIWDYHPRRFPPVQNLIKEMKEVSEVRQLCDTIFRH